MGEAMECSQCHRPIEPGEERQHQGSTLCEDCYIEAATQMKACDPWAVRSAKATAKMTGGETALTQLQARILGILEESGGLEAPELLQRLGGDITARELETQFAILRHMEKARAERRGDLVVLRPW
jgi:hypothetical protein